MSDNQREIGRLEAEVNSLRTEVKEIKKDLKEVVSFVQETKGGQKWVWTTLTVIMSMTATITGLLTYFISK